MFPALEVCLKDEDIPEIAKGRQIAFKLVDETTIHTDGPAAEYIRLIHAAITTRKLRFDFLTCEMHMRRQTLKEKFHKLGFNMKIKRGPLLRFDPVAIKRRMDFLRDEMHLHV
jgi:hypothetical protein